MKEQFLQQLAAKLTALEEREVRAICHDLDEHFIDAQQQGKSAAQIIAQFGDIDELAIDLLSAYDIDVALTTNLYDMTIHNDGVNVEVRSADVTAPTLQHNGAQHIEIDEQLVGQHYQVRIQQKRPAWTFFKLKFNMTVSNDETVTILVPKQIGDMKLTSDIGNVQLQQICAKHLQLKCDAGSIKLEAVEAAMFKWRNDVGNIAITNSIFEQVDGRIDTGNMIINYSQAHSWQLRVDAGKILLNGVEGVVEGTVDAGKISYKKVQLTKPLTLKTDIGAIEVLTKQQLNNITLDAKSDVTKPSVYGDTKNHYVFGTGDIAVKLRTDMGKITVKLADV